MRWEYTDRGQAIHDLGQRLELELKSGRPVWWLLSGGSNIQAAVDIMKELPDELTRGLTVSLVDERYGPVGHADSNWEKLQQAGFEAKQASLRPVMLPGLSFEQTRDSYEKLLQSALEGDNRVIALLGIGDDGHIAGILPQSVAARPTNDLIVAYHSPPFDRLTPSFSALRQFTANYALAFGDSKKPTLTRLAKEDLPLAEQPAQLLKQLDEAYVYNDQVKEES